MATAFVLLASGGSYAHNMFVNAHQSPVDPHTMVWMGLGYELPIDDFLASDISIVRLKTYHLFSPDHSVFQLKLPEAEPEPAAVTDSGVRVRPGTVGAHLISYDESSMDGTYQVAATTVPGYWVSYVDGNGNSKIGRQPLDRLRDPAGIAHIKRAIRYTYLAKTTFVVNKWTVPQPVGHLAEIIPQTQLVGVRAGDLVTFNVLFNGRPLAIPRQTLSATNRSFSPGAGLGSMVLSSKIQDGVAHFRFPIAGTWYVGTIIDMDTSTEESLKHLRDKARVDSYGVSFTFDIKP